MSLSLYRPEARLDGLITTETESDLLIYDTERNALHTLNAAAAAVWRAADGSMSLTEIAVATDLDTDSVKQAMQLLTASNLLVNGVDEPQNAGRRRFLKKAGIVAIPVIVSVSVPLARAAASQEICGCTHPSDCNGQQGGCLTLGSCKNLKGENINSQPPPTGPFFCTQ